MAEKKWIQRAIHREGDLTRWAARFGIRPPFTERKLAELRRHAENIRDKEERLKRIRQINLAPTLKRLSKKHG